MDSQSSLVLERLLAREHFYEAICEIQLKDPIQKLILNPTFIKVFEKCDDKANDKTSLQTVLPSQNGEKRN